MSNQLQRLQRKLQNVQDEIDEFVNKEDLSKELSEKLSRKSSLYSIDYDIDVNEIYIVNKQTGDIVFNSTEWTMIYKILKSLMTDVRNS